MTAPRAQLCLVFDLDDTLYPERAYQRSGLAAAGRWGEQNRGLAGFEAILLDRFDCDPEQGHFQVALQDERYRHLLGEDTRSGVERLVAELRRAYRAHEPTELQLHDDAKWALEHFRKLPLGLITDGYPHVQRAKIAALGIGGLFRHIVVTDELGGEPFRKPCPAGFEKIAEVIAADRYAYVADNPAKDFVAPNVLDWLTIRVVRPDGVHYRKKPSPGGQPNHTIASLRDLPHVLGS